VHPISEAAYSESLQLIYLFIYGFPLRQYKGYEVILKLSLSPYLWPLLSSVYKKCILPP